MTITVQHELTIAQFRTLLQQAAKLARLRPEPGTDPREAAAWRSRALQFLHSPDVARALAASGGKPTANVEEPAADLGDLLDQMSHQFDSHDDFIPIVVGAIFAAYIGLVGYAIYQNVTQSSDGSDAGAPDGGTS